MKKTGGFSVAEILISLFIIGILAVLTVPTLVQSSRDTASRTAWKKEYTSLKVAWDKFVLMGGGNASGLLASNQEFYDAFADRFNVMKSCPNNMVSEGCFAASSDVSSVANPSESPGFILGDGAAVFFSGANTECTSKVGGISYCAILVIDVNALTGPNKLGKDIFVAYLRADDLFPSGIDDGKTCVNNLGAGCSAEILLNSDMIYNNK